MIQVLIPAVIEAFGYIAKKQFYENTQFDSTEVDGSFLNVFKDIQPILDCDRSLYYITIPSTYLILPHQAGITWLSSMKGQENWIRVADYGIYRGLKASVFGGVPAYQTEGNLILFPTMTPKSVCPILLKLAIAYDTIDPYEKINIGPNIINDIIGIVCAPYMSKENPIEKIRPIIN